MKLQEPRLKAKIENQDLKEEQKSNNVQTLQYHL